MAGPDRPLEMKAWGSVTALAAVGAVFVWKYGARAGSVPLAAVGAGLYALGYVAAVAWALRRPLASRAVARAAGAVVLAAVVLAAIAPEANGLARAPAIDEWLSALTAGRFPYGQPSRPSGLPGLFTLAAPFWALGAVWLIPPAGMALLFALAFRVVEPDGRGAVVAATTGLVPVWYEVALHSELVANGAVGLAAVLTAEAARQRGGRAALFGVACVTGLALSTRLSTGLVVAVYGAWALRRAPRWAVAWGALALAVLALTLVPFVLWEPETFRAVGPFSTQARFLPMWANATGAVLALALGWTASGLREAIRWSGGLLVGLATLSFAFLLPEYGARALWDNHFDVTYLLLGVPFLIVALPRWRASASGGEEPTSLGGHGRARRRSRP